MDFEHNQIRIYMSTPGSDSAEFQLMNIWLWLSIPWGDLAAVTSRISKDKRLSVRVGSNLCYECLVLHAVTSSFAFKYL